MGTKYQVSRGEGMFNYVGQRQGGVDPERYVIGQHYWGVETRDDI